MDCKFCDQKDLEQERVDPCYCHINPPCSACTDAPYVCKCGEQYDYEQPPTPKGTYKPKPCAAPKRRTLGDLDRSKIDWMHTGKVGRTFSDIHGYTPEGTTQNELLEHLRLNGRPCSPMFKSFQPGGYFHLSYFTD